ncbi:TetR/AcrR family transcriptional regulator [Occallatibacter riparius]|uniref:TetR/AcrR family transcriptional regulator n=1 Tax=Occallatibacter riparius TaxID=1002689 RepID=A0A9J7BY96_9BACT|nr:TetR/AcrR family transcriptional regulator [Occallatibacter riparius]UWZ86166.1 TetR/AcrR family transcriptional regulator [Occallatibacter riparius]
MDAILSATVQVLLAVGQENLTTTRVAARAGVSVGTLYQYFPNKQALLRAVLERHLGEVVSAVQRACLEHHGRPLEEMASGLVNGFLDAKLKNVRTSTALYAIANDVDGARIGREMASRACDAVAGMLATAPVQFCTEPLRLAEMLYGVFTGTARRLIESPAPHKLQESYRAELIRLAAAYLAASAR